jgi:cytochrome b561
MIEIKVWLILVLLIEVPAIAMVACHLQLRAALARMGFGWLMLTGILLCTFGLCVQVGRSMNYIKFNAYPVDEWFPFWITKDIGISIMLFCLIRLAVKQHREQTPTTTP